MPGRKYAAGSLYRYGFNGKENDNEVEGEGGQQDYGMRIYDPRIGRFLSSDPISSAFPWYTPYQFAGNSPMKFIDLDGLEPAEPKTVEGGEMPNITVTAYSRKFRKPIAPIVESVFDKSIVRRNTEQALDMINYIAGDPKGALEKLKPGVPNIEEIMKKIMMAKLGRHSGEDLYNAIKTIVENKEDGMELLFAGAGLLTPSIGMGYTQVIKPIIDDESQEHIVYGLKLLDNIWKNSESTIDQNTNAYNNQLNSSRIQMTRAKDELVFVTVTYRQFCQIMSNRFFFPKDYEKQVNYLISKQTSLNHWNSPFKKERPAFYIIYLKSTSEKGYIWMGEAGVAPILPNLKFYFRYEIGDIYLIITVSDQ